MARVRGGWESLEWKFFERRGLPQGAMTPIELGQAVEKLTKEEKRELAEFVLHHPPANPLKRDIQRFLLLSFGHKQSWQKYLDEINEFGADSLLLNYLSAPLTKLPPEEKLELLSRINAIYPSAVAKKEVISNPHGVYRDTAPKRAVDFLLRHLFPPDEIIAKRVAEGAAPAAAWQGYFDELRRIVPKAQPNPYGPDVVLEYAKEVQEKLRSENANFAVYIGGTLPAGKARAGKSDVDLFPVGFGTMAQIEMTEFRTTALGGLLPSSHPVGQDRLVLFSRQNPVFVRVTKEKLELVVYPKVRPLTAPELGHRQYPRLEPQVYSLP